MKRCRNYVGVACVDGSCPIANAEEYEERCMDVIKRCDDCFYYKGCDDCALYDTEYCPAPPSDRELPLEPSLDDLNRGLDN